MEDWVSYFNEEKYNFSNSFKRELDIQLGSQLKTNLQYENLFNDYFFNLFIGMKEVNMVESDNHIYADVEIITPDSQGRAFTIAWTSDAFEDKMKIHQSETEGKVQFFFCTDLPTEELKNYIKPKRKKATGKQNNKIEFDVDLTTFPDLAVSISENKKLTDDEKREIRSVFLKNSDIYVSEFSENLIMLDFQIDSLNFGMEEFKIAEAFINECLALIESLPFSTKIKSVEIA